MNQSALDVFLDLPSLFHFNLEPVITSAFATVLKILKTGQIQDFSMTNHKVQTILVLWKPPPLTQCLLLQIACYTPYNIHDTGHYNEKLDDFYKYGWQLLMVAIY